MKKIFILCALILITVCCTNNAFAAIYKDVAASHWAYNEITELSQAGIIKGYPRSVFKPNNYVTRAEFVTMVIRALHQQNASLDNTVRFKDVPPSYWAYSNIQRAVKFDLVKGMNANYFYPNELVTRAHMITMTVNALMTRTISEKRAREILQNEYSDYVFIPDWFVINAAKAEILDMNVKVPFHEKMFNADTPATRAEAAVAVYKMMQEAKTNPNLQLAAAMRPPKGTGTVIKSAIYEGTIITLPVGTRLPITIIDGASTQINKTGETFIAKLPQNCLTQDKYIILYENSLLGGQFLEVKYGKYFRRNGKLQMEVKRIKTANNNQDAPFYGIVDTYVEKGIWASIGRAIFKGEKFSINPNDTIDLVLSREVKIDATNGQIIVSEE